MVLGFSFIKTVVKITFLLKSMSTYWSLAINVYNTSNIYTKILKKKDAQNLVMPIVSDYVI